MTRAGSPADKRRVFLRLVAPDDWQLLVDAMSKALANADIACVLLPPVSRQELGPAREIVRQIQHADIAALVRDDPELALNLSADGLHLRDPGACLAARKRLGPDATIGVQCLLERHAAMVAGDQGADYIAFPVTAPTQEIALEVLTWWHETMVLPSVALIEDDAVDAERIIAATDFYSPPC